MLLLAVSFNAKLSVNQVKRQRKSKVKVIWHKTQLLVWKVNFFACSSCLGTAVMTALLYFSSNEFLTSFSVDFFNEKQSFRKNQARFRLAINRDPRLSSYSPLHWPDVFICVNSLIGNPTTRLLLRQIQISHVTNHLFLASFNGFFYFIFLVAFSFNKLFSYVKNVEMDRKISCEYKQDRGWFHQIYLLYFSSLTERINCFSLPASSVLIASWNRLRRRGKSLLAGWSPRVYWWHEKCHFEPPPSCDLRSTTRDIIIKMFLAWSRNFITHRSRAAPSIKMNYESGEEEEPRSHEKSEMSFDMTQN